MKNNILPILIALIAGLILGFAAGRNRVLQQQPAPPFENVSPTTTPGISCVYKGHTYQDGEGFNDGCNYCSCSNGQVSCTLMACE